MTLVKKADRLLWSILHHFKTELLECFLSSTLFIYSLLLLTTPGRSTIFAALYPEVSVVPSIAGATALIISLAWVFGLLGNGDRFRRALRRWASLLASVFFVFGTVGASIVPSAGLAFMLPSFVASCLVYLRLSSILLVGGEE